ncbi:hypothetical protein [Nocardioides sp. B-3]|uniref:hypothetical protein n=1 Tax=Nocardioides sp. B-3 TaxID=2895565 RepID=UPI00215390D4|nr:hypothetical protein [Nocardioides sp. B-3]UUZ60228.1 hypothetical protein LP418_04620 [Nocardioides sp. B-3]
MRRTIRGTIASTSSALLVLAVLAGCSTDDIDPADTEASESTSETSNETSAPDSEWFVRADYDEQDAQRSATFEGDPAQPWLQYIDGKMTDTSAYKAGGAKKVCFSNASNDNPWRQTGYITMQQQLEVLESDGVISEMEVRDAQADDNTQLADIDYFIAEGQCDVFIISPNSTAAMTPRRRARV